MKFKQTGNRTVKEYLPEVTIRPPLPVEERALQSQQDKGFIKAMNELTAKSGLLSDDPYFGGL
ncbi:hypothetical protein AW879_12285 [Enterobacter cloacae]|nr:hypothetical protein [Enterobacter cloacae]AMJ70643.1 hypothetical protein AW879_12285 [Enterobacter cloacae]EJC0564730.1 hypothetical protein [Enterobacter cloacae]EJC0567938.1 hypothetical protein [Enterobacter cloacae]